MESYKEFIIRRCNENGDFVKDVDGFFYYFQNKSSGHLNSAQLRIIADHLDALNQEWQNQINMDMELGEI